MKNQNSKICHAVVNQSQKTSKRASQFANMEITCIDRLSAFPRLLSLCFGRFNKVKMQQFFQGKSHQNFTYQGNFSDNILRCILYSTLQSNFFDFRDTFLKVQGLDGVAGRSTVKKKNLIFGNQVKSTSSNKKRSKQDENLFLEIRQKLTLFFGRQSTFTVKI